MDYRGKKNLPRGIRNNNPGNLVHTKDQWQGKAAEQPDAKFVTFTDITYGIRACAHDLKADILKGQDTIRKIFEGVPELKLYGYAPKSDGNDTDAYIANVVAATGIPADHKITYDRDTLKALMRIIFKIENGTDKYTPDDVIDAGLDKVGFRFRFQ